MSGLPNLIIIGSAKSGTTALHSYLALHPQIAMSQQKELKLFDAPHWRQRLDWYREQFDGRAPVRGESSPTYTMDPVFPSVPERMHELVPDARLVYLVRDPVERLVAQWVEMTHLHQEDRPLAQAVGDFASGANPIVMPSRYAHQLERFREHFNDEQILVLDQRDLLLERRATLRRVFAFVGVDADFSAPGFEDLHNARDRKRRLSPTALWLHRRGVLIPARDALSRLPVPVKERIRSLATRPVPKPGLDDGLRRELEDYLRPDAERLRALTGGAFEHWSV